MSGTVVFDVEEFKAMHPESAAVPDAALSGYFMVAESVCDNTERSLVKDLRERKTLLYLLVCHITQLQLRGAGTVGLLSSVTEGKVSASFSVPTNLNWYKQTQCGWMYWLITQKYRLGGHYVAYRKH